MTATSPKNQSTTPRCRQYGYSPNNRWAKMPAGFSWREATAVAVDSKDRVFVFNRGDHPVMIFDRDGSFLSSWGEGVIVRAHGIHIGPDDSIYCTDDFDHTVRKFTPDGTLLMTLGTSGKPTDTGAVDLDYRNIRRAAGPFHYPTNLALSPDGEMYVSDGYGNARIHKFSPDGELLFSWGQPGSGPGEFKIPHGIAVDPNGRVYVADRENSRIQMFAPDGSYLTEWNNIARPCEIFIDSAGTVYVAELGYFAGMWSDTHPPKADSPGGRVSIFDKAGKMIAQWGGGRNPGEPGDFFAPHDIWVDSQGSIYVAEVSWSAGGNRGVIPADCPSLQKFVRQPGL